MTIGRLAEKSFHGSFNEGMTLIELMVAISLFSILMLLAVPNFSQWIKNNQIRSTAESLQNGLRLAKAQALSLNRQVVFSVTNANPGLNVSAVAGGVNWMIQTIPFTAGEDATDHPRFVQGGSFGGENKEVKVTTSPSTAALCFNSAGQVVANATPGTGSPCTAQAVEYEISRTGATSSDRKLKVLVSISGQIRMCDPARASGQPDACT